MIVFIAAYPTPYYTPVFNRLHAELGDELCVFYLYRADTCHPETCHGWGPIPVTHRRVVLDHPRAWSALLRALRAPELRAVCVYGHRGPARVGAAIAARLRGIPVVLRGTANLRNELTRPAVRRLLKRVCLRAVLGQPEVWATGPSNLAYWRLLGLRNLHVVPNALERLPGGASGAAALRGELGLAGRFVFAFVCRLEPIKGIMDLLAAYDIVRESTPPGATGLVIAGRGSLEAEVRRYVAARDDCRYLGSVPHERLGAVYAGADVVVVPSHSETWSWVVNEALGFGTPILASTGVAAADELCTEATGRRFPVADPAGLAAAMLAEFRAGPRPVPRLECVDTARTIADRLDALTGPRASAVRA